MQPTTKDLLRVRDGEPVDAVLSSEVTTDPALQQEVRRLRDMQVALRNLPELTPPLDLWERIQEAATRGEPAPADTARATVGWPRWLANVAAVAGVAVLAVMLVNQTGETPAEIGPPTDTTGVISAGVESTLSQNLVTPRLASLRNESRRLEQLVAGFGDAPALVNAATASSIADVQDQILWIDDRLSRAASEGIDSARQEILWRERVKLMNSLAALRYAQAQRFAF